MIIKERTKPISYKVLESLNTRLALSSSLRSQYDNQVKGFEGELAFDQLFEKLEVPGLLINDLLLNTRDTHYQIDALHVTDHHLTLYEIKNYSGSYHYKDNQIFSESDYVIQNPLSQVERKRIYLHNLLKNLGYNISLSAYVVFINPNFYLYSFPKTDAVLFAGQLQSHFELLAEKYQTDSQKNLTLAKILIGLHDDTYYPTNFPTYTFEELKKGITCPTCHSFSSIYTRQTRKCTDCDYTEKTAMAIYRTIEEFKVLFPSRPLTKRVLYQWCGDEVSSSRIQSVLKTNYKLNHVGRSSYYS